MPVGFTAKDRKQLMYSRMLGVAVSTRSEMRSVLTQYASAAAYRLRSHGLKTSLMQVWISSSRFRDRVEHHTRTIGFPYPVDDPLELIRASHHVLSEMTEGHPYNRAGILLTCLEPAAGMPALWEPTGEQRQRLATAVDEIQETDERAPRGPFCFL